MTRPTFSRRTMISLLGMGAVLSSIGLPAWAATRYLVIGTGGTGGVFYPYGGGLAQLLSKKLPDTQATAEVTGGSVDNVKLLGAGESQIGFSTMDSAFDGMKGEAAYKDAGPQPIAALAILYPSVLHVVASKSSGIRTIADIKGKRASVGSAGSSTESIADRVMAAAGLDPMADVTRDNLGVSESVNALKDGKIDVFFWIGGVPTPAVKDLVSTHAGDVTFIETGELAARLDETYPNVYIPTTIKGGAYAGVENDLPVLGVDNVLLVPQSLDGALVKEILAAIFDNLAEVQAIHPVAKRLALESASQPSAVPYHPAAIEFYASRGVKMN
ncbi:MAG: TAXI family TRAP transporter solute-binding subunit [Rhizobiales bacterium]|nr:TAXI family TRAP transporter solute-binding subunit [Hyphomicrobiales bacterium]